MKRCTRSISLDENEYPEPDVFKPEVRISGQLHAALADTMRPQRFLDEAGQCKGTWFSPQDGHVAFGFGRRIWWVT